MDKEVKKLEKIRKDHGMSRLAFTAMLPIARSTYYGWLNGRVPDKFRLEKCFSIIAESLS